MKSSSISTFFLWSYFSYLWVAILLLVRKIEFVLCMWLPFLNGCWVSNRRTLLSSIRDKCPYMVCLLNSFLASCSWWWVTWLTFCIQDGLNGDVSLLINFYDWFSYAFTLLRDWESTVNQPFDLLITLILSGCLTSF